MEAAQALTIAGNGIANTDGVVAGQDVRLDSRAQAMEIGVTLIRLAPT
ncbi:hypothetical protein [Ralstonia syzygii]|nr:hypothetical protein [Ralstonia syzygii]CAH0447132.1 hypothetical protein LMG10661_03196 [Ralstonia syzygii subsp. syzygii]